MDNGSLIFWGTTDICIPFLTELKNYFSIKLIITQPDSIGGRNKRVITPAVKNFALSHNLSYIQPEKLKAPETIEKIKEANPDIGVVISYGKFLPRSIYSLPQFNTINVHFSLLPRFRGAAPVQRAIELGETQSGITIFEIDNKMDTGDIWAQKGVNISNDETAEDIFTKMSQVGAPFLIETLKAILSGQLRKYPQNHDMASYAPPLKKEEGKVNWSLSARQLYDKFRAFQGFPGLFFHDGSLSFKIIEISISAEVHRKKAGDVFSLDKNSLKVCCGERSVLEIIRFQPQNKKPMTPYSYSRGNVLPAHLE